MNLILNFWKRYSYMILLFLLISGFFNNNIALLAILCMISPIILAFFTKKRYWCKHLCPRGSFYDNIIKKFSPNNPTPKILKSIIIKILVIIAVFYLMIKGIIMLEDNVGVGIILYSLIIDTTIIGVSLALFFNHRTWCSICPMGNIGHFISYLKKK